jgi:hypothetical protein
LEGLSSGAAGIAEAGDLKLGAETKVGYDSNVFSRDDDVVDSAVFRLSAWGSVEDELEKGTYKLRYQPTFFINESSRAKNTWNHRASAEGVYHFSPRTSVRLVDEFAFLERVVFAPGDPAPDANINDSNRRTTRNSLSLHFNHMLTRRTSLFTSANYTIFRFNRSRDEDNDAVSGDAGLNYALTKTITLGGGGQLSYRSFDAEKNRSAFCFGEDGPGSRTVSYSGFGFGSYQYDENMSVNLRIGPARIETTQFRCPGLLQQFESEKVNQTTWFARGELVKRWKHVSSSLSYHRFEGFGGSVGSSTVNDTLLARVGWKLDRYWTLRLRGSWIRRVQDAARNPTTRAKLEIETTTWTIAGSVRRQLLKRLSASVDVSYRNQDLDNNYSNPLGVPPAFLPPPRIGSYDGVLVFAGLRYELDPIRY